MIPSVFVLLLVALASQHYDAHPVKDGVSFLDPADKDPVDREDDVAPHQAIKFMQTFGYLDAGPPDSEALYSKDAIKSAIMQVQKFGGIRRTGELDEATRMLLRSPRCGNKDVEPSSRGTRRRKRYVIGSVGWRKRTIRYHVANWSHKLGNASVVNDILRKAFQAWADYSNLNFVRTSSVRNADIVIAFARYAHGDRYPFDGPGFVLAHAFYPYDFGSYGGDIHFDNDEDWTLQKDSHNQGTDFFTVAVHELGHSLGLSHSPEPDSVMFPYYRGVAQEQEFSISYDDSLAMYDLYVQRPLDSSSDDYRDGDEELVSRSDGSRRSSTLRPRTNGPVKSTTTASTTTTTSTTTSTTVSPPSPDYQNDDAVEREVIVNVGDSNICDGNVDAIANIRGELFVFKGTNLWRFSDRGRPLPGYPAKLRQMFRGLPAQVTRIDAVLERSTDSKILFFSGNSFWTFDGFAFEDTSRPLTDLGLPSWVDRVDAAFVWGKNGKAYLFSKALYWRMESDLSTVEKQGYPQKITERWRGIPEDLSAVLTWRDGRTYFFKTNLHWRFDDANVVADFHESTPTSMSWFACH